MSMLENLFADNAATADAEVINSTYLRLPANRRPWVATGVRLRRGQAWTLLSCGHIQWSQKHSELHAGPGFHLWGRVSPGGRIVNVTRNSGSFIADVEGEIELGIYLGMWRDQYGALDTPESAYQRLDGELEVGLASWRGNALAGLTALQARFPEPLLETELRRLAADQQPPPGWDYLLETGTSDVFRSCATPTHDRICLDAADDQGIIRKAVKFPLTPTTAISWQWRLLEHPSRLAEDTPHSHDYISVACEFDNGRDLTWIWSSSLTEETWFDCPIKAWQQRETHYVVRSGLEQGDAWHQQRRLVYADVARAMGTPPAEIVAVWLIVVATFRHGRARAEFERIELHDNDQTIRVL